LPGQEVPGELLPESPTWKFIQIWARRELQGARELNDSIKRTNEETSALRGEIRGLKKLLDLPKESAKKAGLLQSEDFIDPRFAGY